METDQPSAQAIDQQDAPQQNEGIQARINELVAKQRQAEEALKERDRQLMENTAQMAQMAMQMRQQPTPPPQAPVDPMAPYRDQMDPVALQAIQAAIDATTKRMEAQFAPMMAQQAAQIASFSVQAEAAALPNLPKEVVQRAQQLATGWRQAGLNFPTGDAINFALGEYQRGQLLKAAPVMGYNPNAPVHPNVVPGYAPPPPVNRQSVLPTNFDTLDRNRQNAALEQSGILDDPF